jgi:hypothetical protein
MLDLLHTDLGDPTFAGWRLAGFLDEAVQHDDSPADKSTEEDPRNSFCAFQSKLEQTFAEDPGVRLAKLGPSAAIRRVSTTYLAASAYGKLRISFCTVSL